MKCHYGSVENHRTEAVDVAQEIRMPHKSSKLTASEWL